MQYVGLATAPTGEGDASYEVDPAGFTTTGEVQGGEILWAAGRCPARQTR